MLSHVFAFAQGTATQADRPKSADDGDGSAFALAWAETAPEAGTDSIQAEPGEEGENASALPEDPEIPPSPENQNDPLAALDATETPEEAAHEATRDPNREERVDTPDEVIAIAVSEPINPTSQIQLKDAAHAETGRIAVEAPVWTDRGARSSQAGVEPDRAEFPPPQDPEPANHVRGAKTDLGSADVTKPNQASLPVLAAMQVHQATNSAATPRAGHEDGQVPPGLAWQTEGSIAVQRPYHAAVRTGTAALPPRPDPAPKDGQAKLAAFSLTEMTSTSTEPLTVTRQIAEFVWDARSGNATPHGPLPPHAAARPDLPVQIGRQLAEALGKSREKAVEISLNPTELGRVRMTLSTGETGISVNIIAERPEILDLMRRNIDDLARGFADLGYQDIAFAFGKGDAHPDQGPAPDRKTEAMSAQVVLEFENAPQLPQPAPAINSGLDLRL